ncbi:SseB family protein [Foetidibacter luteolus]|uniref:SseB family protein n=1 Tax=Foetidibacter luteolus TaxID=2608880 RepID=UPI00129B730F|nr:SseB family protein [Foetidibacter luteolus]
MEFLKKLFGWGNAAIENTKLNYLLDTWQQYPSDINYNAVMLELLAGNSFLLLPSAQNDGPAGWQTSETGTMLQLSSLFLLDGIKALGAFTTEQSLIAWSANKKAPYTVMRAQDVFTVCQQNDISRLVINSGQPTMFVLDRNNSTPGYAKQAQPTKVLIGTPVTPLSPGIIQKLIDAFNSNQNVSEAYQYGQFKNDKPGIVIGIKLIDNSPLAKAAALSMLQSVLQEQPVAPNLEVTILETEEWLASVRKVESALFYKKP